MFHLQKVHRFNWILTQGLRERGNLKDVFKTLSKMELFVKIKNTWKPSQKLTKKLHLRFWQGSVYVFDPFMNNIEKRLNIL